MVIPRDFQLLHIPRVSLTWGLRPEGSCPKVQLTDCVSSRDISCPQLQKENPLRIRFLTRVSSSVYGSHKPGDIFDWKDDAEAKQLIAADMAEAVKKSKAEKATASKKVETATSD